MFPDVVIKIINLKCPRFVNKMDCLITRNFLVIDFDFNGVLAGKGDFVRIVDGPQRLDVLLWMGFLVKATSPASNVVISTSGRLPSSGL